MHKHIQSAVFTFLSFGCFGQAPVDGFYKGKGNYEAVVGGGFSLNGKFFAGTDKVTLKRDVAYFNLFLAAGITDNLDVYANIPYVSVNGEGNLQDGTIYAKYKIIERSVKSGTFSLGLAAGYSTNLTDYQTEGADAIGQQAQVFDIRPVLHYARTSGWFYTLQGAYLSKGDPVPNAMNISAKAGKSGANYYFDIWYDYQYSFGGLNYRGTPAPLTFRELGVGYNRVGVTYYRPLNDWLGAFAASSYVISGRNVGQGPGLSVGLVFKN